jgi:hypothetical protein
MTGLKLNYLTVNENGKENVYIFKLSYQMTAM